MNSDKWYKIKRSHSRIKWTMYGGRHKNTECANYNKREIGSARIEEISKYWLLKVYHKDSQVLHKWVIIDENHTFIQDYGII